MIAPHVRIFTPDERTPFPVIRGGYVVSLWRKLTCLARNGIR
jgi:hypothetical protein